ncbi:hypothetical protein WDZ92_22470 [Nostoc sp. NIES-2111]
MRTLIAGSILLSLIGSAYSAPLTSDELKQKVIGKSCKWTNGNASGTTDYMANGKAKLTLADGQAVDGTWKLKGNQICDKWNKKGFKPSCYSFEESSPGNFSGSIGFTSTCS